MPFYFRTHGLRFISDKLVRMGAYWDVSIVSLDEARQIAPFNTATSLQVAAGVYSNIIYALFHKPEGERCPWQFEHFTAVQPRSLTNGRSEY